MRTVTVRFDPGQPPTPADDVAIDWFRRYVSAIRHGRFSEAIAPHKELAKQGFRVLYQRPGPGEAQEGSR